MAQEYKYVLSVMKDKIPAIIVSDAPTAGTGFGRITADITSRAAASLSDVYEIATLGYGGINSRHLPCHHYTAEGMSGWIIPTLPEIWRDWAGDERGVVMFISDPARLQWFSRPEIPGDITKYPHVQEFLTNSPFERWIYAPIDASGPNDRLSFPLAQNLLGFDRILAYGKFGEDVIRRSIGEQESEKRGLTNLPHGINSEIFYPRDRKKARAFFFSLTGACTMLGEKKPIERDETCIGILATNQSRKDYGLGLEAAAILSRKMKIRLWIHCDAYEKAWSIPSLLLDFGLAGRTVVSVGYLPDAALAQAYSAMDVVFGIAPEGFGYVHVESLACGTPCITGSFAGGAELVSPKMRIDPIGFRYESVWGCKRPVYNPEDLAVRAETWIGQRAVMDHKYDWKNNWPLFEKWFREGSK
jgi:glycosyltransferase involved in cell wall biosynthesis